MRRAGSLDSRQISIAALILFLLVSPRGAYTASVDTKEKAFFYQSGISFWVLESYDTQEWVLKHNASFLEMFGEEEDRVHFYYNVVVIHPDCNWVFLFRTAAGS